MKPGTQLQTLGPRTMNIVIGSKEWLAARRSTLTATDAAAVLGVSPFRGPFEVWASKRNEGQPFEETPRMHWGNVLERPIAEEWARERSLTVGHEVRVSQAEWASRDNWASATPDFNVFRLDGGQPVWAGLLEVKNSAAGEKWAPAGAPGTADNCPPNYIAQCLWQMYVTGAERCWLTVLLWGYDSRTYQVWRDEDTIAGMADYLWQWWRRHVVEGEPPEPDGSDGCAAWLKHQHPHEEATDERADVSPDDVEEFLTARALRAVYDEQAKKAAQRIKMQLGDSTKGRCNGASVSWGWTKGKVKLDTKALEADAPALYQRYAKTGAKYRTLRIKRKK